MKRFYYVFLLLVVSMFLFTSCAPKEIELKMDPTIQAPIVKESITMSEDIEDIENTLSESFSEDATATITQKSDDPLTYGVDLKIFDREEILDKLGYGDFSLVPKDIPIDIVTPASSVKLASFSSSDLGILEDIELDSLPATLVITNATGVTVDATLTSGDNQVSLKSGVKTDLADIFNVEKDLMLESMSITFTSSLAADASPTIKLLVDFPFEFTITKDIELYTNEDEVGDVDIFGRNEESAEDWNNILDGIESLKLHMKYDNTTGLPLKMEVQGWDVDTDVPIDTDSEPVTVEISVDGHETVEFDLTDLKDDMKDTVPFNLVFTVILPQSETGTLNMDGSLDLSLWLDLDTDITIPIPIPITLGAQ